MGPHASPRVLCFGEALVDRLLPVDNTLRLDKTLPAASGGAANRRALAGASSASAAAGGGSRPWSEASDDRLGGAPANVACGLARLGTPAAFLGGLGTDAIGQAFAALFAERGVETGGIQWDSRRPSRVVLVHRDAGGERRFAGFRGDQGLGFADQDLDAGALRQVVLPWLKTTDWLLCGTLPLASPGAAAALEALLALLPPAGSEPPAPGASGLRPRLAVDVNWRPTFWGLPADSAPPPRIQERLRPLLERASLLKCAAEEARWLFGGEDPQAIGAALPRRPGVCVTDGPGPLRWSLGGRSGFLVPFAIDAVDTTGAGDAFMAGLLHGLCQRDASPQAVADPEAVVRFAAACGSLVCRGAGAIDHQPTDAAVRRFLAARCATDAEMLPVDS